ncbi:DNA methyltransferase 1-associated protein 1 [Frankliniella occidentalis]|uniref:DNA methyltransferase 1-associated protein 1 n=1 Tax=Frankliniella occidentalis TaxID=133901 RepID=A0A6J1S6K2_FRAOC|nr:DNA methyltransferase 1-associated protein 1 [Frankliniella occidentalis]
MGDVQDILGLERPPTPELTKEAILGSSDKLKKKQMQMSTPKVSKRPEGMPREVFALLCNDSKGVPPVFPTDTGQGYKQTKAKLGMRKVRPWKWMPFTNPGRTDGAVFHHWRRVADEGKEYPFAKFNKKVPVPSYTDDEYNQHLQTTGWTKEETNHLIDLAKRFDLRFIVMKDRFDKEKFTDRSVEELKERFYTIQTTLTKVRSTSPPEGKPYVFDADHERRRKEQLKRIYERTQKQIEEEQSLVTEYRRIEARKKERDKKTQDLQKLITAADSQSENRRIEKKLPKKKLQQQLTRPRVDTVAVESTGIKFPDMKGSGVSVRSQRMKMPANVGQKKIKGVEQLLQELGVELNPMPTEEICTHFNELRSDMVLLHELKAAFSTCEFELQTLRHQYEALCPGKTLDIPVLSESQTVSSSENDGGKQKINLEIIDVVGSPGTPNSSTHLN